MSDEGLQRPGDDGGNGDHRPLARLVADSADEVAVYARRLAAAESVSAEQRALLGWVLIRLGQILDELR